MNGAKELEEVLGTGRLSEEESLVVKEGNRSWSEGEIRAFSDSELVRLGLALQWTADRMAAGNGLAGEAIDLTESEKDSLEELDYASFFFPDPSESPVVDPGYLSRFRQSAGSFLPLWQRLAAESTE